MNRFKAKTIFNDLQKKIKVILRGWTECSSDDLEDVFCVCWRNSASRITVYLYFGDTKEGIRVTLQTPHRAFDEEWREVSGKVIDSIIDTIIAFEKISDEKKK